jgi:hypothetical protein
MTRARPSHQLEWDAIVVSRPAVRKRWHSAQSRRDRNSVLSCEPECSIEQRAAAPAQAPQAALTKGLEQAAASADRSGAEGARKNDEKPVRSGACDAADISPASPRTAGCCAAAAHKRTTCLI